MMWPIPTTWLWAGALAAAVTTTSIQAPANPHGSSFRALKLASKDGVEHHQQGGL